MIPAILIQDTDRKKTPILVLLNPAHKAYALLRSLGCAAETKRRSKSYFGQPAELDCYTDADGNAVLDLLRHMYAHTNANTCELGRYFAKHPEMLAQLIAAQRLGASEDALREIVAPLRDGR